MHTTAKLGHVSIMAELLKFGADLNAPTRITKGGETPLHKAVYADKPEMVRKLDLKSILFFTSKVTMVI